MNSDKTRVLKRETYERHSRAVDDERRRVRDELTMAKERAVLNAGVDADEVVSLVERAGIDEQTQFDIFYHGTLDLEDIVEQLRPHLVPDDIELAFGMYSNAVSRAPDSEAARVLGPEEFHGMLSSSLTTLIAARDVRPLPDIASLVSRFPSETELLTTYLRALAGSRPTEVLEQVDIALSGGYMTAWQQAWLLGAAREVLEQAPATNADSGLDRALALAQDEEASWLARVEAARLLGAGHRLDQELLSRLWAGGPAAVRSDLAAAVAAAAANLSGTEPPAWTEAFLDSLHEDPLLVVVLHRSR
jgi:hypothetical protein